MSQHAFVAVTVALWPGLCSLAQLGVSRAVSVHLCCRAASQGAVQRVMVIDLDVHQGNGVERDKLHWDDRELCIVDM